MTKRLIINADDYGMSRGIVDGIIQCAHAGIVTSTTMMATGEAFDYGLERLAELGLNGASIGVHLNVTSGESISHPSEIPSLLDSTGRFVPRRESAVVAAMKPEELEAEFRRQIERVLKAGIRVSHLDNHHNWIYFSPTHFRVVTKLANELELPLRYPFGRMSDQRLVVIAGLIGLSEKAANDAIMECHSAMEEFEVQHTDSFWIEFTSIHRSREYLKKLLSEMPVGISELCVHPGLDSDRRKQELTILLEAASEGWVQQVPDLQLASYSAVGR